MQPTPRKNNSTAETACLVFLPSATRKLFVPASFPSKCIIRLLFSRNSQEICKLIIVLCVSIKSIECSFISSIDRSKHYAYLVRHMSHEFLRFYYVLLYKLRNILISGCIILDHSRSFTSNDLGGICRCNL